MTVRQSSPANVPKGSQIEVSVYVKSFQGSNDCDFELFYEGQSLAKLTPMGSTTQQWQQMKATHTVTGSTSGLAVVAKCDAANNQNLVGVDDASIVLIQAPAGQTICGSPTGSAPAEGETEV